MIGTNLLMRKMIQKPSTLDFTQNLTALSDLQDNYQLKEKETMVKIKIQEN